jgi:hypothetical protein
VKDRESANNGGEAFARIGEELVIEIKGVVVVEGCA